MKFLRIFRIAFALIFFIAISLQFFDVYHKLPKIYYMYPPASLQFMPAVLKFFAGLGIAASWAFIAFAGLALILGRAYCSFICPFGIMMDIFRKIAKFPSENKFLKNTALGKFCLKNFAKLKYSKGLTALRAIFLGLAILAIIFGFGALLGLIDPYSLYGKIMGGIFIVSSESVNAASATLANMGYYDLNPVPNPAISIPAFGFSIFLLILTALVSAFQGRLFCNTLCPVGAFLGGLSKFALLNVSMDSKTCVACGKCERTCKAKCINVKERKVDFSRCVLCFDCMAGCPKSSLKIGINPIYKKLFSKEEKVQNQDAENISRRRFAATTIGAIATLSGCAKHDEQLEQKHSLKVLDGASEYRVSGHRADKRLASPPGSKSIENFLENCTGCQRCISSCKSQVLKASVFEWGLQGFMQPYMDFSSGFCLPNCHNCTKTCPTGAIQFLSNKQKMEVKIGTAIFNEKLCVVYTDGTDCAACAEHCPVQAIEMIPFDEKKSLYIPHVHESVCIGCGACEYICPVRPHQAIVVQGLKVHTKAKPFEESMRLYVPQKQEKDAPKQAPKPLDNPFPF